MIPPGVSCHHYSFLGAVSWPGALTSGMGGLARIKLITAQYGAKTSLTAPCTTSMRNGRHSAHSRVPRDLGK
jgi:hypothetical protein